MPKFRKKLEMRKFHGYQIPQASLYAVLGAGAGVYFFWNGKWRFIGISGFYIDMGDDFDIAHSCGENPIIKLK